jgi:hypothetical protein
MYRKVSEMWENETVVLVVSLKKRIMGGVEKVRFGRISADNSIPPFIKLLFKNRVEEYLVQESPLTFRATPHFDLKPEDIDGLKGQILDVFREAAFFRQDEVEELLRQALVLRLDYLVKPVWTMNRLLFEKKNVIVMTDLEKRLDPFSKVLPYAEQLIKECRRLGYNEIEKDEYQKLAGEVVEKMAGVEPLKLVLHDFSVLTDFLSETKGEEIARVEGAVVNEFLDDRSLTPFKRAIEVEMKLGAEDFDAAALEITLKRFIELKQTFGQADIPTEREFNENGSDVLDTASESVTRDVAAPADEKTAPDESWDLDSVLGEETPLLEPETEKEEPIQQEKPKSKKPMRIIRRDQKEEEETLTETEPLESLDAELVSEKKSPFGKKDGFRESIDDKTEKVFIKKLFNGDGDAYGKLLQRLDDAESWRVAKILIDNELFKRDVDPFSREAIKLVDLIYSRYYPEEGVGGKR